MRLAHFGKRVCIFERHYAPGGLNSFYSLAGRKYDVGLHAVTNFVRPGVKGTALTKVLRQLRIEREEFDLSEQRRSRVAFGPKGERELAFTNDLAVLESEVARLFPREIDGFRRLSQAVRDAKRMPDATSARVVVRRHIADPVLEDMVMCPVLFYGSACERDLDFGQFAMLYEAIFLEGLARPLGGIRPILAMMLEKYRRAGGERRMKCGVKRIIAQGERATALVLDTGEEITARVVLSSIGAPETFGLMGERAIPPGGIEAVGRITFVETMSIFNRQPAELGWGGDTVLFFNDSDRFDYSVPTGQVDVRSGVVCFPNNFEYGPGRQLPEGIFRATCLANYALWSGQPEEAYRADKQRWFEAVQTSVRRFLPPVADADLAAATVATDMFTPRTIERFTGRPNGAIYGSPVKHHEGRTPLKNVFLCGTDQGLLGIIGSMLSGVMMANAHALKD